MKSFFLVLGTAALGLAIYLVLNAPETEASSSEVDQFGNRANRWGDRQRLGGTGNSVAGSLKKAVGDLTGSDDLSTEGTFDQAKGAVKDTLGKAAEAAGDTLHDLNR